MGQEENINPENPFEEQAEEQTEEKPEEETEGQAEEQTEEDSKEEQEEEPKEEGDPEEEPEKEEETEPTPLTELAKGIAEDVENDDQARETIENYIKDAKDFQEKTRQKDEKLRDIINSSPDFADLLYLIGQGASYEEAHGIVSGDSDMDFEKAKDGWQKAAKERQEQRQKHDKALEEVKTNMQESFKTLDAYAKDNKLSKEDEDELMKRIDGVVESVARGNITKDILDTFYKGTKYEKDMSEEKEKAEVKGRNEAIKDVKNKGKKKKQGDGLPHPDSQSTQPPETINDNSPEADIMKGIDSWSESRRF